MQKIFEYLRWASVYGLWDIISLSALISGGLLLFKKRKKANDLNFHVEFKRDNYIPAYPLRVEIMVDNRTHKSVVLSSAYFKFGESNLRADPRAFRDSATGNLIINMPDKDPAKDGYTNWNEPDYLLRHRDRVKLWFPIDPTHSDEELAQAIQHKSPIGIFICKLTWVGEKISGHPLEFRVVVNQTT